jgi:hypothetical protein
MAPLTTTNFHSTKASEMAQPKKTKRKNLAKILKEKSEMLASQIDIDQDSEDPEPGKMEDQV